MCESVENLTLAESRSRVTQLTFRRVEERTSRWHSLPISSSYEPLVDSASRDSKKADSATTLTPKFVEDG
jgi:hypothetical protein